MNNGGKEKYVEWRTGQIIGMGRTTECPLRRGENICVDRSHHLRQFSLAAHLMSLSTQNSMVMEVTEQS